VAPELLHIDLDGFFVAVERLHAPHLQDRPVVIGGQPTAWGCVVAASPEAARCGVRPGLSLAVAAMKCPEAVFLDGSIERYLDASAAVDEILREPMAPVEWTAVDSVFLDLTGLSARLGPSRSVAERLQDTLRRELGFDVACGLAGTRSAAQIASRLSRPRGVLYVLPGYEARLLAPLDVGMLPDLPPGARTRLVQNGTTTIAALGELSPEHSRELLGARGPQFVERARGLDVRGVDGSQPPRSIAREITLAEHTDEEARLVSMLGHVCDTLSTRLRHMGWFAHTVAVRLTVDAIAAPAATITRTVTLREAVAHHDALLSAARALLRVLWRRQPVSRVGVVLSNLQRVGLQMPLFPLSGHTASGAGRADHLNGLRTRQGLRTLVESRYIEHRPRRRAG
jgi:DNA polymerase-4